MTYLITNLINALSDESVSHKNIEIIITVTNTTPVKLVTSSLSGQVIFLNSLLASFKNWITLYTFITNHVIML